MTSPSATRRQDLARRANQARLIVNSAGVFGCTLAFAKASWSCEKVPRTQAAAQEKILNFYTPAHWVSFLKEFSLAAGFAGDKISTSTITVHGFTMSCVDFVASGVPGKSKICTTAQHLLGYVNVASESTAFEIISYSTAPSAGAFRLPRAPRSPWSNCRRMAPGSGSRQCCLARQSASGNSCIVVSRRLLSWPPTPLTRSPRSRRLSPV